MQNELCISIRVSNDDKMQGKAPNALHRKKKRLRYFIVVNMEFCFRKIAQNSSRQWEMSVCKRSHSRRKKNTSVRDCCCEFDLSPNERKNSFGFR